MRSRALRWLGLGFVLASTAAFAQQKVPTQQQAAQLAQQQPVQPGPQRQGGASPQRQDPVANLGALFDRVKSQTSCSLISAREINDLQTRIRALARQANNPGRGATPCRQNSQELTQAIGGLYQYSQSHPDMNGPLGSAKKGVEVPSAVSAQGGGSGTSAEEIKTKLDAITAIVNKLNNPTCTRDLNSTILEASAVLALFNPALANSAAIIGQSSAALFRAFRELLSKNPMGLGEKVNICQANRLMQQGRSAACQSLSGDAPLKIEDAPEGQNAQYTIREMLDRVDEDSQAIVRNSKSYQSLTALQATEAAVAELMKPDQDHDPDQIGALKSGLASLFDGLRCDWRAKNACDSSITANACEAVLRSTESRRMATRCTDIGKLRQLIDGDAFGETSVFDTASQTARRETLTTLSKLSNSGALYDLLKRDLRNLASATGSGQEPLSKKTSPSAELPAASFSPYTGEYRNKATYASYMFTFGRELSERRNQMGNQSDFRSLEGQAFNLLPDFNKRRNEDLDQICRSTSCIWAPGADAEFESHLVNQAQFRQLRVGGYSPFDAQTGANLNAGIGGVPERSQGGDTSDLGYNKLIGRCMENPGPSRASCALTCQTVIGFAVKVTRSPGTSVPPPRQTQGNGLGTHPNPAQ